MVNVLSAMCDMIRTSQGIQQRTRRLLTFPRYRETQQRPPAGEMRKKFSRSMSDGFIECAILAPRQSLKNCAASCRSSIFARCIPRQVLEPAPKGANAALGELYEPFESMKRSGLNLVDYQCLSFLVIRRAFLPF